jgi:hypothetical protein
MPVTAQVLSSHGLLKAYTRIQVRGVGFPVLSSQTSVESPRPMLSNSRYQPPLWSPPDRSTEEHDVLER